MTSLFTVILFGWEENLLHAYNTCEVLLYVVYIWEICYIQEDDLGKIKKPLTPLHAGFTPMN